MNHKKIHIPKPCHENWLTMSPAEKGRFCHACQKTVFDFTKSSDRSILQKINTEDNVCGRFLVSQLDRELVVPNQKPTIWTAGIAAVLSLSNFENNALQAQTKPNTEQIDKTGGYTKGEIVADFKNKREISGVVMETNFPLPGTKIINLQTLDSTVTDFDGLFKANANNGDVLQFVFLGYKNKEYIVKAESKNIEIHMQPDLQLLDHIVLTGEICVKKRTFFGRIFHNIGSWLR